jgi:hypothetical protein
MRRSRRRRASVLLVVELQSYQARLTTRSLTPGEAGVWSSFTEAVGDRPERHSRARTSGRPHCRREQQPLRRPITTPLGTSLSTDPSRPRACRIAPSKQVSAGPQPLLPSASSNAAVSSLPKTTVPIRGKREQSGSNLDCCLSDRDTAVATAQVRSGGTWLCFALTGGVTGSGEPQARAGHRRRSGRPACAEHAGSARPQRHRRGRTRPRQRHRPAR